MHLHCTVVVHQVHKLSVEWGSTNTGWQINVHHVKKRIFCIHLKCKVEHNGIRHFWLKWVGHLWLNGWDIMVKWVTVLGDTLQKSDGPQGNILSDHCMNSWPVATWHDLKNNYNPSLPWSYTCRCTSNFISICKELTTKILPALWLTM